VPDESFLELKMDGGAELEIRGPAALRLEGANRIYLNKGRLLAYVPERARGFTIATADGEVVDLGTRFVTSVDELSGTEVHVMEGLVKISSLDQNAPAVELRRHDAGRLKGNAITEIDYIEERFDLPLAEKVDPAVERNQQFLKVEESFANYPAAPVHGVRSTAFGIDSAWQGGGKFSHEGLAYRNQGRRLVVSGGALKSDPFEVGDVMFPSPQDCGAEKLYISFLMKLPVAESDGFFSGLLLYTGEKEELFVGKISIASSFGSRLEKAENQESFHRTPDQKTHLFVVRLDRAAGKTDVFMDPVLGLSEEAQTPNQRYDKAPEFDRIMLRSGGGGRGFSVAFDEVRLGENWNSVLPLFH
jgi:hypothetical protein